MPSGQESLAERLGRFPLDRYPVQHATTQFHLGSELLHAGHAVEAEEALTVARKVFATAGMPLEMAKATVMLGVALRDAGRLDEASAVCREAMAAMAALNQPAEQAAAAYNLGLVRQDAGDVTGACDAWTRARELFLLAGYPGQAGAAARDHGAALVAAGRHHDALPLLREAVELAERAGDEPGAGAAANVLGLALLGSSEAPAAVTAFGRALGASPRSVRPAEHAMAKANLALAHEQCANPARARLAALQAIAVPEASAPIRAQARQLLARLPGSAAEDLLTIVDSVGPDEWSGVLRGEVLRAADLDSDQRIGVVGAILSCVLARPGSSYDLAEALLHIVLELPPDPYQKIVVAVVGASAVLRQEEAERVCSVLNSAMARFAMPQWQRLATSLNAAAAAADQPQTWR